MSPLLTLALLATVWLVVKLFTVGRRERGLPPGPPTLPILGNILSFPTGNFHFKFTEWAKQYGEICSLKIASQTMIVINSHDAARDILEKNSKVTAARPNSVLGDIVTDGLHIGIAQLGPNYRATAKAMTEILGPQGHAKYEPVVRAEASQLLFDLLSSPQDFFGHALRFTFSSACSVGFGRRVPRLSTPFFVDFLEMDHAWLRVLQMSSAVDLLPILRYLPDRIAPWGADVNRLRKWQQGMYMGWVKDCEDRVASGKGNGCGVETIMARWYDSGATRQGLSYVAGVIAEAGTQTSAVWIQNFVLFMVTHPDAQKRAQAEIDAVVGHDRTPTMDDLDRLPYVQGILKEISRIRPVAPVLFPHRTTEDVTYKGYLIPSGSVIFNNFWYLGHDAGIYDEPERFMPERWMDHPLGMGEAKRREFETTSSGRTDDPLKMVWGNGRRVCKGMHFATLETAIVTMNLLWAFNFSKSKGPDGQEITPDIWAYDTGVLSQPKRFPCVITPRSSQHAELIYRGYREAGPTLEPYEHEITMEDREWVEATRYA
ncbi:hypothetical protein FRB99_003002 [Tulasnella sp. 403]|nr:hypothetical protein FRB99_003002 [Tulasnella sp. 403]